MCYCLMRHLAMHAITTDTRHLVPTFELPHYFHYHSEISIQLYLLVKCTVIDDICYANMNFDGNISELNSTES